MQFLTNRVAVVSVFALIANRIAIILYCLQLIPTYAVVYFCAYEAVELKCLRAMFVDRYSPEHKKLKPVIVLIRWVTVCIQIDEFVSFVLKMMDFALKMMNSELKLMSLIRISSSGCS